MVITGLEILTTPTYSWAPIIALVFMLVTASGMGFWLGFRASLYLFIFNLIAYLISIFLGKQILSSFDSLLQSVVESFLDEGVNIDASFIERFLNITKSIGVVMMIIIFTIGLNFFAFFIYWIFRKFLKSKIKKNKELGNSNLIRRLSGATVSLVSVMPITVAMVDVASIVSPKSGFTKANSKILQGITFNVAQSSDSINYIATIFANQEVILKMYSYISGEDLNSEENRDTPGILNDKDNFAILKSILGDEENFVLLDAFLDIMYVSEDYTDTKLVAKEDIVWDPAINKFNLSSKIEQLSFLKLYSKVFNDADMESSARENFLYNYLEKSILPEVGVLVTKEEIKNYLDN